MRNLIPVLLLLAGLLTSEAATAQQRLDIKLQNVQIDYNRGVGEHWSYEVYVNDRRLLPRRPVTFDLAQTDTLAFHAIVVEHDADPDRAEYRRTFSTSRFQGPRDYLRISLIVRENEGRQSGSTAKWDFFFRTERYRGQ